MSSLYDYMRSELRRGYILENDEQRYTERREKFYIFLKIPFELERVRLNPFIHLILFNFMLILSFIFI
jgi:hypothetical protein